MADKALAELLRQLRRAVGDIPHVMELVRQGEDLMHGDPQGLCSIYQAAQYSFGPLQNQLSPEEYGELSVKRLQALRRVDPQEAKTFYRFLAKYNIRQNDKHVQRIGAELGLAAPGAPEKPAVVAPMPQPIASANVLEPPAATAKAAARTSSTPIRPRSLRYSGCSEDSGGLTGYLDAGLPKNNHADQVTSPTSDCQENVEMGGDVGTIEWTRLTGLEPIMECESPREHVPCGTAVRAVWPLNGQAVGAPSAAIPSSPMMPEVSQAPIPLQLPSHVPKTFLVNGVAYAKVKIIGRGGTSKVYEVLSPQGQIFALKRASTSCSSHFEALANEVSLLRHLKNSPNIIQVFDAEVFPQLQTIHIVMERGDIDLGNHLKSAPALSLGDLKTLWRQMLEAVHVVHDQKIVHSDLKPMNFLRVGQKLKLIDFGIAKKIASNTTHISRNESMGTISYMAPEAVQAAHKGTFKIGRPSDVWSLGIILYQMVYFKSPFHHLQPVQRVVALTDPHFAIEFPALDSYSDVTKAQLLDVLGRCLQRDPRKRPTIPELLEHPFLSGEEMRLERSDLEALMRCFFCAAKASICEGALSEVDANCEDWDGWQVAADEVWQTLSRKRSRAVPEDFVEALAPFKQCMELWLVENGSRSKRHRPAEQGFAASFQPEAKVPVAAVGAFPAHGSQPALAITGALATGSAVRAVQEIEAVAIRRPLAAISTNTVPGHGPLGVPAICSEMLQKQRGCLRKAAPAIGKENAVGPVRQSASQPENMVLRRLKDRRAMVVDEKEEFTQMTRWGVSG